MWLRINDELIFEGKDADPLAGGHLAFRLRGISGEPASCLIRNLTVDATRWRPWMGTPWD
jgi:hypothetical protein